MSGGRFDVELTSDLMKAFEHGATRTEVLKGMAEGLIGTPGRLLKAAEDGDWEAVGKEAVNLYPLVETVKASPKYLRQVPALFATAQKALRLVRVRTLGLRLRSPRLVVPEAPPVPREPVYLGHDPAAGPRPPTPQHGPQTTPSGPVGEPKYLGKPPETQPAPRQAPQPDNAPSLSATIRPLPLWHFANLFLKVIASGKFESITVERVHFGAVTAIKAADGVLTLTYDIIQNLDRIRGQGKLLHQAFEEAAKAVARETGATRVRVGVGLVQDPNWAAYLTSRGYALEPIHTVDGLYRHRCPGFFRPRARRQRVRDTPRSCQILPCRPLAPPRRANPAALARRLTSATTQRRVHFTG